MRGDEHPERPRIVGEDCSTEGDLPRCVDLLVADWSLFAPTIFLVKEFYYKLTVWTNLYSNWVLLADKCVVCDNRNAKFICFCL